VSSFFLPFLLHPFHLCPGTFPLILRRDGDGDGSADDRCNITDDGKAALLRLSKGDMRRALNVLQVSAYVLFLSSLFHCISIVIPENSPICWLR